mgnify:CR=1 FL=1
MQSQNAERAKTGAVTTDPVCGMKVDPATARHAHVHAGISSYFCCEACRAHFVAAQATYLAGPLTNAQPPSAAPPGTLPPDPTRART